MLNSLSVSLLLLQINLATLDFAEKSDGEPFGSGRPFQYVEEIDSFPDPKTFNEKYIIPYKPVKMKNVAKISPAFTKWTDDYFISLREPKDHTVSVETMKKENRSQDVRQMSFIEFVKQYNTSGIYMVNPVPPFIGYETIYHNFILSYV